MKTSFSISSIVSAILFATGCASAGPTADGGAGSSLAGAKVEVIAEGGFAALSMTHRVDHDSHAFSYAQRRLCGAACGAPMDTASGVLPSGKADSLFTLILEQTRMLAQDDYGTTRNGADMMTYTIRVTSDGRVKTIRGDDGTIPPPARRIMSAVRDAVTAAR